MANLRDKFSSVTIADLVASNLKIKIQKATLDTEHTEVLEEILRRYRITVREWIENLGDSETPGIGRDFLERLSILDCEHKIDLKQRPAAVYNSFYKWGGGEFVNTMTYGEGALAGPQTAFHSEIHEDEHGLQKHAAAALHISPFNANCKIVVCPEDWMLLEQRCEEGAYARQSWFGMLLGYQMKRDASLWDPDPFTPEEFWALRQKGMSVPEILFEAANQSMKKSYYSDNPNSSFRFANSYHDVALQNYITGITERVNKGETGFIFVRVEPEDVWDIGNTSIFNCFGKNPSNPDLIKMPPLLPFTAMNLKNLRESYKIPERDTLPTLREALASLNMTKADLIRETFERGKIRSQQTTSVPVLNVA